MSEVKIDTVGLAKGPVIRAISPFSQKFVDGARQLGGKWDGTAWVFDQRHEERVRLLCMEVYGTDGTPGPVATLHVNLDALNPDGNELMIGPIQALRKISRDSAPRVGEGCAVIAGGLKNYGGSARYPQITWLPGTVVEVQGVPLPLAQKLAQEKPDAYTLVIEATPGEGLTPQEQALLDSLKALAPERLTLLLVEIYQFNKAQIEAPR
jgi:hypothetical protein